MKATHVGPMASIKALFGRSRNSSTPIRMARGAPGTAREAQAARAARAVRAAQAVRAARAATALVDRPV